MNSSRPNGEIIPVEPSTADQRRKQLEDRRAAQSHKAALTDLKDESVESRLDRRERRAEAREQRALAKLNRRAKVSGARVRIAHDLTSSGEIRALRVVKVRKVMLAILVPVLAAFVAWSTIGVQEGIVKLMGVKPEDPMWFAAWFVEPALGTIIAGIIIARAVLRSSGGDLDWRATAIEWGMLTVSLVLNLSGSWPDGDFLRGAAAMVAHSIGPIGTMVTAVLISVIDDGVNNARPFEDAVSVADPVVPVDSRESTHLSRLTRTESPTHPERSESAAVSRLTDSPESTHRPAQADSGESTHPKQSESVILTHRLDVESPGSESGESTQARPSESAGSESTQKKPSTKVIQAKAEPVADRRQLVFNTFDAAVDAGGEPSHAEIAAKTGVPKATVTRYLKSRVSQSQ